MKTDVHRVKLPLSTRYLPLIAIVAAGVLAYSNTFAVPYLFDDDGGILNNPRVLTLWPSGFVDSSRPVVEYTFSLNFAIHGFNLWGYHALNLAIHIAAGLCLYGIASRTFARLGGSLGQYSQLAGLAVALLWVVHPLQTQAVTYLVQRHESLMGLFFLATLYCFIRGQDSSWASGWYLLSVLACLLGMGCKQVMFAAPLVVLWYDRAFISTSWRELWNQRKFYYVGLFASWGFLAWTMQGIVAGIRANAAAGNNDTVILIEGLNSWNYLLTQAGVITHYLRLCFWPSGQCLDYKPWPVAQTPLDIWPQGLLIVGLVAATVWAIFHRPKLSFLGGWFFLILAPTSSILPIADLVFEHRMYLPLAAVIAAVVVALPQILNSTSTVALQSPRAGVAALLAVALILGLTTFQRNSVYATKESIWKDVVAKRPGNSRALAGLGRLMVDRHEPATALDYLERALRIDPYDPGAQNSMGDLLFDAGKYLEAVKYYRKSIALTVGENDGTANSLAVSLIALGQVDEAEAICFDVLKRNPGTFPPYITLANIYLAKNQPQAAAGCLRKALEINPDASRAHAGLAQVLAESDPENSLQHMREALRLEPQDPSLHLGLGNLIARQDPVAAIPHFENALKLRPDYPEALMNLSNAYVESRQIERAIRVLERLVKLQPSWEQPRANLEALRNLPMSRER